MLSHIKLSYKIHIYVFSRPASVVPIESWLNVTAPKSYDGFV